jgi:hypothetical protein
MEYVFDAMFPVTSGLRVSNGLCAVVGGIESLVPGLVAGFFGIWFLLTMAAQVEPIGRRLWPFDSFGLIPKWTFFAPNPGHFDYHVLYRVYGSSCEAEPIGQWQQLRILTHGTVIPFLWHPRRRVTKSILDAVNGLIIAMRVFREQPDMLQLTTEYMLLLHLVVREAPRDARVQFALVSTWGIDIPEAPQALFLSRFHRTAS